MNIVREYSAVVLGDLGVGKTSLVKNAKESSRNPKHFSKRVVMKRIQGRSLKITWTSSPIWELCD